MAGGTLSALRFVVGDQEYGVSTRQVLEVIRMVSITPLPTAPDFVQGVINRRGQTTPVLNLRRRLGLEAARPTSDSRMIIAEVDGKPLGIVVDRVTEVASLPAQSIDAPSSYPIAVDRDFVFGVARTPEGPLVLLDLEHLVMPDQRGALSDAVSA